MKIVIEYFDGEIVTYKCKDCKFYESVVMEHVEGETASFVRVPLFNVKRLLVYNRGD